MGQLTTRVVVILAAAAVALTAACGSEETSGGTTTTASGSASGGGTSTATGTGAAGGASACEPGATPLIESTNGPVAAGTELSIQGCRFGAKDPAAPLKWDDFEAGTIGDEVGNGWLASAGGGNDPVPPRYSSDQTRAGSSRSVHQDYTAPGQYNCNFGLHDADGHTRYFISFYRFATMGAGPDRSRNYKIMSLRAGSPTHWDGPPTFRHDMYPQTTSGHSYLADCDQTTIGDTWANGYELVENSWERFDYFMDLDQGSDGSGNARYYRSKNGEVRAEGAGQASLGDCAWTNIYLNGYFARNKLVDGSEAPCNDGCPADFWVDDVYIDITPARIDLCDQPSWSSIRESGAHCELQIPISWSDTSITVRANVGALGAGTEAYLYVVDGAGAVNETGFAVSVSP